VGINAFGSAVDLALRIKLKKDGGASAGDPTLFNAGAAAFPRRPLELQAGRPFLRRGEISYCPGCAGWARRQRLANTCEPQTTRGRLLCSASVDWLNIALQNTAPARC
jgi:hypothetical protein